MKRDLLCVPCGMRSLAWVSGRGEIKTLVKGKVKIDHPEPIFIRTPTSTEVIPVDVCVCDSCNTPLPRGADAVARTISWKDEPVPEDVGWEADYLESPTPVEAA